MRRLLFLDIDGVLNSARSAAAYHHLAALSTSLDAFTVRSLDPVGVSLINKITVDCHADIIVSSSHRLYFRGGDLRGLCTYMQQLGIEGNVLDMTPHLSSCSRGEEIKVWLDSYRAAGSEVERYLIIDDDGDMLPEQRAHFVQTSWKNGLTFDNYKTAMLILGNTDVTRETDEQQRVRIGEPDLTRLKFKENDEVFWHSQGLNGYGLICGISSEPIGVAGRHYIVQDLSGLLPNPVYPYTRISVLETSLELRDA